jgi:hypothetical protein
MGKRKVARIKCKWRDGFRYSHLMDADEVGKELAELRAEGDCSPRAIWRRARRRGSVMNGAFTWDVQQAAEERWEEQARYILRHHILAEVEDIVVKGVVRSHVFKQDKTKEGQGDWIFVAEALMSAEGRADLLSIALRELEAFRRKYADLSELCEVFRVIKEAVGRWKDAEKQNPKEVAATLTKAQVKLMKLALKKGNVPLAKKGQSVTARALERKGSMTVFTGPPDDSLYAALTKAGRGVAKEL